MKRILGFALLIILLAGCSSPNPVNQILATSAPSKLNIIEAPDFVCSAITQIRLQVQTDYDGASNKTGKWELLIANSDTTIHHGTWELNASDIFITFPDGDALPAGTYRVDLRYKDQVLTSHEFTVSGVLPAITDLNISMIPQHTALEELDANTKHFYINFNWVGGCQGAPYWVKVYHKDELICRHSATLTEDSGNGSHACYTQDGLPFDPGMYTAVFTLMDDAEQKLEVHIIEPELLPTPSPTPDPHDIHCGEVFAATGVLPENEIYRPLVAFEWYTQAIYVGAYCENLMPGIEWSSTWYRDGEFLRSTTQTWAGSEQGTLWDAFTGTLPYDPFVYPGTYTSTLEIGPLTPVTIEFEVVAYVPKDNNSSTE